MPVLLATIPTPIALVGQPSVRQQSRTTPSLAFSGGSIPDLRFLHLSHRRGYLFEIFRACLLRSPWGSGNSCVAPRVWQNHYSPRRCFFRSAVDMHHEHRNIGRRDTRNAGRLSDCARLKLPQLLARLHPQGG